MTAPRGWSQADLDAWHEFHRSLNADVPSPAEPELVAGPPLAKRLDEFLDARQQGRIANSFLLTARPRANSCVLRPADRIRLHAPQHFAIDGSHVRLTEAGSRLLEWLADRGFLKPLIFEYAPDDGTQMPFVRHG